MDSPLPTIAILGASGLIGEAIASALARQGFPVVAVARRFTRSQRAAFGDAAVERPVAALRAEALTRLCTEQAVDIVVNCIGVLQDSRRGGTDDVHAAFVGRLAAAIKASPRPILLIHLSIPGAPAEDATAFSRSKRAAEQAIAAAGAPFVILRPGFVLAPAAYGGSALLRALAMLPFALPAPEAGRPFATTDVADIAATVAVVARRWRAGHRDWRASWDVMAGEATTVGDVVEGLRRRLGGPAPWLAAPAPLLRLAALCGDGVAHLGWSPPVRSTALAEMRRGVAGDPGPWSSATGIEPLSFAASLARLPASVQEKWFARLYLAKPLVVASLAVFWVVSGLVALSAFEAAVGILTAHGFPPRLAEAVTVASSLADIAVGIAIAFRRSCRAGLWAGIAVSLFYMAGAALITPELWLEPLGALVKTGPAIVLMLVSLAILDER